MIKKVISLSLICILVLGLTSCKEDKSATENTATSPEVQTEKNTSTEATGDAITDTAAPDTVAPLPGGAPKSQQQIETYVETLIGSGFQKMDIDTLTVLQDRSVPNVENYKVYAMISWSEEMEPAASKTALEGYSTTISEMINANCENVSELSLVWLVPHLPGRGNVKYIKVDGFLSLTDLSFDSKFGSATETTGSAMLPPEMMEQEGQ